jgi:hypothetical protein
LLKIWIGIPHPWIFLLPMIYKQMNIRESGGWRKEYGGMRVDQAKKLKILGSENQRLKTLIADLSLDNAILKETLSGN